MIRLLLAALAFVAALLAGQPALPRCQEDAVLVGTGAFVDGQWSSYVCGPAVDDFRP